MALPDSAQTSSLAALLPFLPFLPLLPPLPLPLSLAPASLPPSPLEDCFNPPLLPPTFTPASLYTPQALYFAADMAPSLWLAGGAGAAAAAVAPSKQPPHKLHLPTCHVYVYVCTYV